MVRIVRPEVTKNGGANNGGNEKAIDTTSGGSGGLRDGDRETEAFVNEATFLAWKRRMDQQFVHINQRLDELFQLLSVQSLGVNGDKMDNLYRSGSPTHLGLAVEPNVAAIPTTTTTAPPRKLPVQVVVEDSDEKIISEDHRVHDNPVDERELADDDDQNLEDQVYEDSFYLDLPNKIFYNFGVYFAPRLFWNPTEKRFSR